jgi:hypothetical protein
MIQAGEEILRAAPSALRTELTVPKNTSRPLRTISVNGLLATELALDSSDLHSPWRTALPSATDFQESMPFLWHPSLQALLPPGSLSILEKQKKKISSDWTSAAAAFPSLSYDTFVYHWLLVSTRTFFFTSPKIKRKPLVRDDCLALIPLADLFNHADVGCDVAFSPAGYSITAHLAIEAGEEVCISYGNHSNDFLLVEYGFMLSDGNQWDQIPLDDVICPLLSAQQRVCLEEEGFWAKYVLDAETVCYRTQVALRLLCLPVSRWRRGLASGFEGEGKSQKDADGILLGVARPWRGVVEEKIKTVEGLDVGLESQRATLIRRWRQIHKLLSDAISRIED